MRTQNIVCDQVFVGTDLVQVNTFWCQNGIDSSEIVSQTIMCRKRTSFRYHTVCGEASVSALSCQKPAGTSETPECTIVPQSQNDGFISCNFQKSFGLSMCL